MQIINLYQKKKNRRVFKHGHDKLIKKKKKKNFITHAKCM